MNCSLQLKRQDQNREVKDILEKHRAFLRAILLQPLIDAQQGVALSSKVALRSLPFGRAGLRRLLDGSIAASRLLDERLI